MTRARDLSRLGNKNVITASTTNNVGIGSTIPDTKLDVVGDVFVTGVVTATSYSGDGSNLTGIDATQIQTGNTSVQTVDTGSDGHVKVNTEGTERLRITSSGLVGIGTTNPDGYNNAARNLVIEGGTQTGLTIATNSLTGNSRIYFADTNSAGGSGDRAGQINYQHSDNVMSFVTNASTSVRINSSGDITPGADATQDLGSASARWANIYSADLQLSNEGSTNDVDGTWGKYTIQEGENDLFLINRRTGKKYKFNLTEVE